MEKEREFVLQIDFNNVIYTSYYQKPLLTKFGINVNAVKGFFLKLRKFKDIFEPDYIVFASDYSRQTTFRKKMYPQYKGKRKTKDDDIIRQMKIASQLIGLLGFKIINDPTYEADDILGMMAKRNEELNREVAIVSSDRDLYQLITENTFIMSPTKNEIIDLEYMKNQYKLTPAQWIDYKILKGDPSDNIPGVPGIGDKTSSQLVMRYGSIDNIYKNLDDLKNPRIKHFLERARVDIPFTRKLVTIITDYTKIKLDDKFVLQDESNLPELMNVLAQYELFSLYPIMKEFVKPPEFRQQLNSH